MSAPEDWSDLYPTQVLREYAVLADGERGVLVGPDGEFAWMCFPGWSDPAVFSTLVGGKGLFAVTPVGERYVWGGHYEEGGLIWRSRWVTTGGLVECREALARPTSPDKAVLLRDIEAVRGEVTLRVVLDPRAGYGTRRVTGLDRHDDVWAGRSGDIRFRLSGLPDAKVDNGALVSELALARGERRSLVLELSTGNLERQPPVAAELWGATEREWRTDVPDTSGLWASRDVRHAYALLRGLTSSRGGMVAAATTSLPERADMGRNYDYRYVWVRDLAMTGQAVAAVGPHPLLQEAVEFVVDRILDDGARLKPAYAVGGGPVPDESDLELDGYPGGHDRIGNRVTRQFQLDTFGEALLLLAAAGRHDGLAQRGRDAVRTAVAAIEERYGEDEAGIWEIEPRRWTHSRLICAAGLRGVARLATASDAGRWASMADRLVADVDADALHRSGRWQRAPDDDGVDAALLLPVIRGAVPIDDPRASATVEAVLEDLGEDHFLYRFRHGPGALSDAEGGFLLCGFDAAIVRGLQGDLVDATRWFERNRTACGPPGIFTEEYDVVQRQLRGNLPQAFVHGALIEASAVLSRL